MTLSVEDEYFENLRNTCMEYIGYTAGQRSKNARKSASSQFINLGKFPILAPNQKFYNSLNIWQFWSVILWLMSNLNKLIYNIPPNLISSMCYEFQIGGVGDERFKTTTNY